jgi:hypothetical protein
MTTDTAAKLAEEAATNGAEPVAKTASLLSKVVATSTDLGIGFIGVAIMGAGGSIAAQSFKHAWKVAIR